VQAPATSRPAVSAYDQKMFSDDKDDWFLKQQLDIEKDLQRMQVQAPSTYLSPFTSTHKREPSTFSTNSSRG
jgi:hypothetical protein